MSSMTADLTKKLKHYRISESEYQRINELLGRPPQGVEWAIFSALWSEHCSYKSSRMHLKKFASTLTPSVLQSQGENAGIVDLGQGEKVVFKMESHNHPSFIEPYQGAATGVGGILRDIFTMGARPIASADFLCFGEPKAQRMPFLVDGVVRGIAGYGNSVGVPTVTGFTQFDSSYNKNILVNAMSVGLLLEGDPVALSGAKGPGNDVVYVGAKTGKDGVHGAAMASESFDENSEAKKPNVQIGDPFFEKLLIESCLEVIRKDLVVSIQDMGAAGLTSSSFEMASKGGLGFDLELDKVPLRDSSVGPEEILLSESQERMLLICEPGKFKEIEAVFARWGLEAVRVGKVRSDRKMRLTWKSELLTEMDPDMVVENAPMYDRPYREWVEKNRVPRAAGGAVSVEQIPNQIEARLKTAKWGSREAIYRQYDQRVGAKTARGAESEAALLRLPSGRGLMIAVGCRSFLMKCDARLGARDAVILPSLKMALKGGNPIGVTDCLNFGNPEKPAIMSEFVASVEAIRDVSMALGIPVISGNVSFYNETQGENITSTPAIGVVGLRESVENCPQDFLQGRGSAVLRVEFPFVEFAQGPEGSLSFDGDLPLERVRSALALCRAWTQKHKIFSSLSVGEGGWLWSLLKMTDGKVGFNLASTAEADPHLRMRALQSGLYEVLFEVPGTEVSQILTAMNADLQHESLGRADLVATTTETEIKAWGFDTTASDFKRKRAEAWRLDFEDMA